MRILFIITDVDDCPSNNPCLPHGICQDHILHYICVCNPGYTGVHCHECKSSIPSMPLYNKLH